jgi:hypothetical protein
LGSTRTSPFNACIIFTKDELQWACNEDLRCECDGGDYAGSSLRFSEDLDPYEYCHSVLNEYTSRELTFESDKLPALAGVASRLHELTRSAYLAGIWKDNAVLDICFKSRYSGSGKLSHLFRAPTFSWAAFDGPICYDIDSLEAETTFTTLADDHCDLKGTNTFGAVHHGFLILHGPVLQARLSQGIEGYFLEFGARTHRVPMVALTVLRNPSEVPRLLQKAPVSCLHVGIFRSKPVGRLNFRRISVVIVFCESRAPPGSYERIGYVELACEGARSIWKNSPTVLSWQDGEGRTGIRVV